MEKGCPSDVSDGRPNLLPRVNHIHTERIHGIPPDIIPVHPRDQDLAFVVVDEQPSNHLDEYLHEKYESDGRIPSFWDNCLFTDFEWAGNE